MKKKFYLVILFILSQFLNGCGYNPIFVSENLNFKIVSHTINGDIELGKQIFEGLEQMLQGDDSNEEIAIFINVSKSKVVTSKSSAGKVLEYRITLKGNFRFINSITDNIIIDQEIVVTQKFKVQDRSSETEKFESVATDNLVDKISQNLFLKISQRKSI